MVARIAVDRERLAAFCRRSKVTELALFGSVIRDDFGPASDVDVLVGFEEGHGWTLLDLAEMEAELEAIFGRRVDLWSRRGVEQSRNPDRRRAILDSAEIIHAA